MPIKQFKTDNPPLMYFCREQDKKWSRLSAHHKPFVWLIACILTFCDKKYHFLAFCDKKHHILMFRNEADFFKTVLQQYNVQTLFVKRGCCHADALSPGLPSMLVFFFFLFYH